MTPTARELDVLRYYLERQSFKEAARDLGITTQAAKNRLHRLYERLDVHTVIEATIALGWLQLPPDLPRCGRAGRCRMTAGHRGPHLVAA